MLELRASGEDIVAPYAERYPGTQFHADKKPWEVPVDIALPCATQNELNADDARQLLENGVKCVAEVSNMGCTAEAVDHFLAKRALFAPGKAVNAGGVATSGLEMTQNAMHLSWSAAEVDERLHPRAVSALRARGWWRVCQLCEGCQRRRLHESGTRHDGTRNRVTQLYRYIRESACRPLRVGRRSSAAAASPAHDA